MVSFKRNYLQIINTFLENKNKNKNKKKQKLAMIS